MVDGLYGDLEPDGFRRVIRVRFAGRDLLNIRRNTASPIDALPIATYELDRLILGECPPAITPYGLIILTNRVSWITFSRSAPGAIQCQSLKQVFFHHEHNRTS